MTLRAYFPILIVLALLVGVWGCTTKVTRTEPTTTVDLSGYWNDADSRMVAEDMIKGCLAEPWLKNFTDARQRPPVVIVGKIMNRTMEHLSTETFIDDLQMALVNSGKVQFVANKDQRNDIRAEREDQQTTGNTSKDTMAPKGAEIGADYMLKGAVNSITDEFKSKSVMFYQVDLQLIDLATNKITWIGQKKIKKFIQRNKFTL